MVSELDCLILEHVVFSDDLDFCLWEMLQQGGSKQILGYFDMIETRAVLIMKVSPGVIFSRAVF